ncbi:MAG: protein translocase subunit SecF [Candidatus Methanofastidiosia archaeon]
MTEFRSVESLFSRIDLTSYPLRLMVGIPITVLLLAIAIIALNGINLASDLQGGTLAIVENADIDESFSKELNLHFKTSEIKVGITREGTRIDAPATIDAVELKNFIQERFPQASISTSNIGPTMGRDLQRQAINALLLAFAGMTIVVFIVFRTPVPSFAVILSAFSDIVISMGFMSIFSIKLGLGTVAALLMIIGYSVDSDILLTTRLLKRRGELSEKVRGAMITGVTMTSTTLAAVVILFLVSQHPSLDEIAIVLIFALATDLMNTWMLNTGILMWYVKRIEKRRRR